MSLPPKGSVLGIDVGFSPVRRSSAVCRLDWDGDVVVWRIERFRYIPEERRRVIAAVAGEVELAAVAIDGPLGPDLVPVTRYRLVERLLTVGFGPLIGKPGASSAPVGRRLAQAASEAARTVTEAARIADATHPDPVHASALVEAFPSSFLGLLLADPSAVTAIRRDRSDVYYAALASDGTLGRLIAGLIPLSMPVETGRFAAVTDHDERAALVCALTAMAVAGRAASYLGDRDGRIALPPLGMMPGWAADLLMANASRLAGPQALLT